MITTDIMSIVVNGFVDDLYNYGICFFKHKTACEMRISDWSSDVCYSDLQAFALHLRRHRFRWLGAFRRIPKQAKAAQKQEDQYGNREIEEKAREKQRSEERRVGKEGVSTCRSRWSTYH